MAPPNLTILTIEQAVAQRERARDLAARLESELFATRERAAAAIRVAGERENVAYAKAAALAERLEAAEELAEAARESLDNPGWFIRLSGAVTAYDRASRDGQGDRGQQ